VNPPKVKELGSCADTTCTDRDGFRDAVGVTCAAWRGHDCRYPKLSQASLDRHAAFVLSSRHPNMSHAPPIHTYSRSEARSLQHACRASCRLCQSIGKSDLWSVRDAAFPLLSGPLPIVPIDAFVAAGLSVQRQLTPHTYRSLVTLNSHARTFGNVLTLGTIHLAPDSAAVHAFRQHVRTRHPLLRELTIRVHADEHAALRYVMAHEHDERTWAVLVFYSLPLPTPPSTANASSTLPASPLDVSEVATSMHAVAPSVRYAIRLNYSTLPNTNYITDWISSGLDPRYQRYTLSGFLSLQALVDDYAFAELASPDAATPAREYHRGAPAAQAITMPFPTAAYSQNPFCACFPTRLQAAIGPSACQPLAHTLQR
jgi:hypothetical protein